MNTIETTKPMKDFKTQLRVDLAEYLDNFDSPSLGLTTLSENSNKSVKTIRRYLDGSSTPARDTIVALYRTIHNAKNDSETIRKMPAVVREFVAKDLAHFRDIQDDELSFELTQILLSDTAAMSIYLQLRVGSLSEEKIRFKFGSFGMDIMKKFVEMGVATEVEKGIFEAYKVRVSTNISYDKKCMQHLISEYFHEEKGYSRGEHYAKYEIKEVAKSTYNEVLKIKYDASVKIGELLKSSDINDEETVKMWYASVVDTMDRGLIRDTMGGKR